MDGILLVRDKEGLYEEILIDIDYSGFSYDYEKNTTRQISFTAFETKHNKFSYDLLTAESVVIYQGQEFVIKPFTPKTIGQMNTKEITAVHVSFTVRDHYQYNSKETAASYTLDDIMQFAIGGNNLGFTYEIIGDFAKQTIESINNNDASNLINDIACGVFGAIFYGDNKHLKLYSEDEWYREAQQTFRYLYNTNEVSASFDTTNLKTYIKAYGKEKENKDAKSDTNISRTTLTFNGKWSNGKTATKNDSASFTFKGTGVDVYFKKSKLGGKVHIDVDGSNSKTGTTYSEKDGTLTLTIRGLEDKNHTCNIKFLGTDTKNPNTKKVKSQETYNQKTSTGKIVRKTRTIYTQEPATLEVDETAANIYNLNEGDNRYEAVVTYTSPAADEWGVRMAPPVSSDTITDKDKLTEFAKSQLQDYPDLSLNISYTGKEEVDVRDVWMLIHEPLGITSDVKLVSMKSPHPYTRQPQSLTFSSAHKDMLKIQSQINKSIKELSTKVSSVNSTVSGNLPSFQEASKAIAAVTGKVEFDSEVGIKTVRKRTVSTSTFSIMSTETDETEVEAGSIYIGNGSITVVDEEGTETDVITPDGIDLSKGFGSVSDEVIDDITERIDLTADYMYLTAPNGTKFMFSIDDDENLTMVRTDEIPE